ncbi:DUF4197 domain-containing protein [Aquifex sp.]
MGRKALLIGSFLILNYAFGVDLFKEVQKYFPKQTQQEKTHSLSEQELSQGIREALVVALKRAVERAGKEGGFWNNPQIRIPPPEPLNKVGKLMKSVGLKKQVEAFERKLNEAAEKAVREATPVFLKTAKEIKLEDLKKLWKGGDTAITDYFREKTSDELYKKFYPVVKENLQKMKLTQQYNKLVSQLGFLQFGGVSKPTDLNDYVTKKALDGLFKILAEEEKRIRTNPMARTTDLLKKLFGEKF